MSDDKKVTKLSVVKPVATEETTRQVMNRILEQLEANEAAGLRIASGIVTVLYDQGRMEMFHLGKQQNSLEDLGMLRLAEELIIEEII